MILVVCLMWHSVLGQHGLGICCGTWHLSNRLRRDDNLCLLLYQNDVGDYWSFHSSNTSNNFRNVFWSSMLRFCRRVMIWEIVNSWEFGLGWIDRKRSSNEISRAFATFSMLSSVAFFSPLSNCPMYVAWRFAISANSSVNRQWKCHLNCSEKMSLLNKSWSAWLNFFP